MINNQNKNLPIFSSNKIVIQNNLFDFNSNEFTYYTNNQFNENDEYNSVFNINKNNHNFTSLNNENAIYNNLNNYIIDFDDIKKLNQTNIEISFQQSMINNIEKPNIFSINDDNLSLENNNTSKKRKLSINSSYLNFYNKENNENKIISKKKGRKRLNEISNTNRNKFAKDNINKKIKRFFLQCFLSELIQTISKTKNISIIKIKKFNEEIVSQTNITFNIDLFNLTLRELLKTEISKKYKNENIYSSNENEKISNLLEQMNDFKILLDMKLKEIYKIFIKNKEDFNEIMKTKFNIDFDKNFEYYVNSQNDQKYREKLLFYGNNYEKEYLNEKNARKLRKRKNLINN